MTTRRLRPVLWAAAGVLVLALAAFLAVGANSPADPSLAPPDGAEPTAEPGGPGRRPARVPVDGFGEIGFGLAAGTDQVPTERCALLAETDVQVQRGLMGRRDLSGYDGMIFRFGLDTTSPFYMRNVPIPLEIAWFGSDGSLVSTAEMAPCPDRDGCPTYGPAAPYRYALEVGAGGLERLGVGAGTVLVFRDGCG